MNESSASSVGQALREAREAQGLTVEEVANRLRLMHRQIDAMEAENFETLGQPVFARGFVRNYARLLNLDSEALLARMVGAPADAAPVSRAAPPMPRHWLTSPWVLLLLLAALFAAAVPVGLYWWLNHEGDGDDFPLTAVPPALSVPAVESSALQPVAQASAMSESVAAPAVAAEPEVGPTVVETTEPAAQSILLFDFSGESWVEVKDASGRMLMRQLNLPGSRANVQGQPPFDVLVGNAAQVRMSYNDRQIDLAPFIDVTVARFTLEE